MSDFLAQLRRANLSRAGRWHGPETVPWTLADWSNAMVGEAGEAANVVKKIRRGETGTIGRNDPERAQLIEKLGEELADTIIYADLLAAQVGIDLRAAIRAKFDKVSEREGFPEHLTPTWDEIRRHHNTGSPHGFCNDGELPGYCDQVPTSWDST